MSSRGFPEELLLFLISSRYLRKSLRLFLEEAFSFTRRHFDLKGASNQQDGTIHFLGVSDILLCPYSVEFQRKPVCIQSFFLFFWGFLL